MISVQPMASTATPPLEEQRVATTASHDDGTARLRAEAIADCREHAANQSDPARRARLLALADRAEASTLPPVFLEEADLSEGTIVFFRQYDHYTRAVFDPRQADHFAAETLLRVELGRRNDKPVGLVIGIHGVLVLTALPPGEPGRIEQLGDGRTRFLLDIDQVPLERALDIARQVQEPKNELVGEVLG